MSKPPLSREDLVKLHLILVNLCDLREHGTVYFDPEILHNNIEWLKTFIVKHSKKLRKELAR